MTARARRVALLDVNVLLALFHPSHVHHDAAQDWFHDHQRDGWATCPVTENGFLRIASSLPAADTRLRPKSLIDHLRKFCTSRTHHFWGDAPSLRDPNLFDLTFVAGPSQLTDVYLLGVATKMGGCLATFDRHIPVSAVVGATPSSLAVIGPDEGG